MRCGPCFLHKNRNAYKDLVLKTEENNRFGPSSGRKDNEAIQIRLKEMDWKGVDCIATVTKLPVP
jgi:hypothetical protein